MKNTRCSLICLCILAVVMSLCHGKAKTLAIMICRDTNNELIMDVERPVIKKLIALRERGVFSQVPNLAKEFFEPDFADSVFRNYLEKNLGISRNRLPCLAIVELDSKGNPVRCVWSVQVEDPASAIAGLLKRLGIKGSLFVSTEPPGASIRVNNAERGVSPLTVNNLEPGIYTVSALKGEEFESQDQVVKVEAGQQSEVSIALRLREGTFEVTATPEGAQVYIDSQLKGEAGKEPLLIRVRPGAHSVVIRKEGYEDKSEGWMIEDRQILRKSVSLSRKRMEIRLMSEPAAAEVYIDGEYRGKTAELEPLLLRETIGSHKLLLKKEGFEDYREDFTIAHNESGAPRTIRLVQEGLEFMGKNKMGFKEFRNRKDGSILILVPAGDFPLGSSEDEIEVFAGQYGDQKERFGNEHPQRSVFLRDFYIGKYEVTNAQYQRFIKETHHDPPHMESDSARPYNWAGGIFQEGQGEHPVVLVSWNDAQAYCKWAGLRLPKEQEWEKSARGADGRLFPWGNQWDSHRCNCAEKVAGKEIPGRREWEDWLEVFHFPGYVLTDRVGSFPEGASPYGALDMAGNVLELCDNFYDEYPGSKYRSPDYGKKYKVIRGGAWQYHRAYCRTSYRGRCPADCKSILIGFRVALGR